MQRARRSIVVFLMAFSVCTLAFAGSAQAHEDPTGSYIVTLDLPLDIRLLLTVDKRNTLIFTSNTDLGKGGSLATPAHGTWSRMGTNDIAFVAYSFTTDSDGSFIATQRLAGTATTSDDFETATLAIFVTLFDPDQDVLDPDEMGTDPVLVNGFARRIPVP